MTHQERADRVAEMIEQHLGIRGKSLENKLRRAGRMLPKSIHQNAAVLVDAVRLQNSPKLARRIDETSVENAYDICEKYLSAVNAADRRKGKLISFLSTNALNLIVITAAVIAVLMWRGFL